MKTEKQEFIEWLESDITSKECIMNRIIDIYANLENHLLTNNIYIREPFKVFLIRFSYFLFKNSSVRY